MPYIVLSTMGNAQVMLYNYKPITIQFYVTCIFIAFVVISIFFNGSIFFFADEEQFETITKAVFVVSEPTCERPARTNARRNS